MKKTILTALLAFGLGLGLTLIASTPSMAVHKGTGQGLTCGNCHTMHSSQGGTNSTAMGGTTGSFILLRGSVTSRAEIHNFCLQCHSQSGAQAGDQMNTGAFLTTPPKVHLSALWTGADFSTLGAGGAFGGTYAAGTYTQPTTDNAAGNDALGVQHSIGRSTVTPPGNTTTGAGPGGVALTAFTCTTCHDPHGTTVTTEGLNSYRNLKAGTYMTTDAQNRWTDMNLFGNLATSYVGAVAGSALSGTSPTTAANIWPIWRTTALQNSYLTAVAAVTLGGTALDGTIDDTRHVGISAFCAQCHGAWHEARYITNKSGTSDWNRHPVNNRLVDATPTSGGSVNIFEFAHYNQQGDTTQAPYTATTATKLPAAQGAVAATRYYADDNGDKVFCLSCHFAHGSIYNDILRWNYTSAVSAGSQIGNGIASNVGCQQCHNR
jgi:hypothetical protein